MIKVIIPKVGYYRNISNNRTIHVDKVSCGQNEIYGLCNGVKVISDYNTVAEFEYIGLSLINI